MSFLHQKLQDLKRWLKDAGTQKAHTKDEKESAKTDPLESPLPAESPARPLNTPITSSLTPEEKIALFMDLFQGRRDVFPKRWENTKIGKAGYAPACHNEWVRGVCNKPKVKCRECPHQAFIPVTPQIIRSHFIGEPFGKHRRDATIGVYPLLQDETCWFLSVDFDKEHWKRDAKAYLETCATWNVPAALERSRSGNGGHVWIFFSEPIPSTEARKMGSALLTETMEKHPEIGFESYDRFFPNQDTMPAGGFGNLIAFPLQYGPRLKGNSVFVDENFEPYSDQWTYLASLRRMTVDEVRAIVEEAASRGKILGVRLPLIDDEEKPWELPPSRIKPDLPLDQKLPASLEIVLSNQIFIPKKDLPPALITKLIRLAAFQNPEFYSAQAMRLSTFGKPRIVACAEDFPHHIGLPRGCADEAITLLSSLGISVEIQDQRHEGVPLKAPFLGELTADQKKAFNALIKHDTGVLSATTAFGKTVVAANMIAARQTNTLILVHRKQ